MTSQNINTKQKNNIEPSMNNEQTNEAKIDDTISAFKLV